MSRPLRIFLVVLFSLGAIFIGAIIYTNYFIKDKIENFVTNRLPENIEQTHENLVLDVFEGTITFTNAEVSISNKTNRKVHTTVTVEKLIIEDVSYWDYLFNEQIHIEDIKLKKPVIKYYKSQFTKRKDSTKSSAPIKIYKPILIDELSIDNTELYFYDDTKDSTALYAKNLTIEVNDILIDSKIINRRLPLEFGEYDSKADSIFLKVSPFENLMLGDMQIKDKKATFNNVILKTKYSRKQLSEIISKERDHYNVALSKITIDDIGFGFKNRKFFAKSSQVLLENPKAYIFRNKLIEDDLSIKPLYSKMLRELSIDLTVPKLKIENAYINYTEKVKQENDGGTITISKMDVDVTNVGNTYKSPKKTEIKINGTFMETSKFYADWNFDINNKQDQFYFALQTTNLPAEKLNIFTEPNLKVRLEGEMKKADFTINGNDYNSNVDMKINYDDFNVAIMKKEGDKKNWLLSTITNIFVRKDSKDAENNTRQGSGSVERARNKSIFNFIWLNVREGLLKSLTGSAKNKD